MLSDGVIAVIRTVVPSAIGTLIAVLIGWGVNLDASTADTLSAALIPVCISAYYAVVALLERKVNPAFGWLLGQAKAPTYEPSDYEFEEFDEAA